MSVVIHLYRLRLLSFTYIHGFIVAQHVWLQHVCKLVKLPRLCDPFWKETLGGQIKLYSIFLVIIIIIYSRGYLDTFWWCPFQGCMTLRSWPWLLALGVPGCGGSASHRDAEMQQLLAVSLCLPK